MDMEMVLDEKLNAPLDSLIESGERGGRGRRRGWGRGRGEKRNRAENGTFRSCGSKSDILVHCTRTGALAVIKMQKSER